MHNNYYLNFDTIKNPNTIDVLVNKYNYLGDYIPNDLIKLPLIYSYDHKYLRKDAYIWLDKMIKDAKNNGINLLVISAYRSYDYQEKLFANYVDEIGYEKASLGSAKAGFSEHQTGLVVDLADLTGNYMNFENTKEFVWMINNAHKYGFILRYPKDKTYITGYKYEPWHYRYVGNNIATYLTKNNLTLEEYKKN